MRRIIFLLTMCLCVTISFSQVKRSGKLVEFSGKKYYLHKVEAGQTMYSISKSYATSVSQILDANHKNSADLAEGEVLKIPYSEPSAVIQSLKYKHYIVKKGDTLYSLAKKFGTSEKELSRLNAGVEVALVEGRRLIVPLHTEAQAKYDKMYYYHTVQKKETLSSIGRRYGLSLSQIKKHNKAINPDRIRKGDEIRIPIANARAEVAAVRTINKKTVEQKEVFVEKDGSEKNHKPLTRIPESWKGKPLEEEGIFDVEMNEEDENYIPDFDSEYKMAVFLPLRSSNRMLNYYQGMLLAMQENSNVPVSVEVFDSNKSGSKVRSVLQKRKDVDFIVGPYTSSAFKSALPFADKNTTLVSLLSKNDAVYEDAHVLQLNTTEKTVNHRIAQYVVDEHPTDNIVIFNGSSFEKYTIQAASRKDNLARLTSRINAVQDGGSLVGKDYKEAFKNYLNESKKNIVLVPISNYKVIGQVLNSLNVYSMHNIEVVGYYKWKLLPNIDPETLFNLNVTYFTPFHYLSTEQNMFVDSYKERFQAYPDDFSYMGYATMTKLLKGIESGGRNFYQKPLQKIVKHKRGGYESIDLKKVQFKSNFDIIAD